MSLELDTLNIQINEPLEATNVRTVVDTDIIVPDSKPDVLDVLQVSAISSVTEKYIQKDHITVSGIIDYTILYSGDGEKVSVKSIDFKTPFSQQIEVSGVKEDMFNYVKAEVQHIEYFIRNSRKINVKSVISLDTNVIDCKSSPVITGVSSNSTIPVKSSVVKAYNLAVCSENNFEVEDSLSLTGSNPSIEDILKSDIRVESRELKVVSNKAVAKGSVLINTLYTYDEDIYYMENEIPFTEVMDVDGITTEMQSEISYSITNASIDVQRDENGDNTGLSVKVSLNSLIKGYEDEHFDVISDVYSPDYELSVQRKDMKISEILDTGTSSCVINDSMSVEGSMPQIVKVYNLIASPFVESCEIAGKSVEVKGHVSAQLLYLSDSSSSPVYCIRKNIPFTHNCEFSKDLSGARAETSVNLEHSNYTLHSETRADVRISLKVCVNVLKENNVKVITDIKMNEDNPIDKKGQPGIIIYFAQNNDSLWDIAKRYNTTIDEIVSVNNIDEATPLKSRQQLLIPKRTIV